MGSYSKSHEPNKNTCYLSPAPSTLNDSTTIPGVDEDGDDTEYNYLADTRYLEEEKEEFRDDRAVRISSRCGQGCVACVIFVCLMCRKGSG